MFSEDSNFLNSPADLNRDLVLGWIGKTTGSGHPTRILKISCRILGSSTFSARCAVASAKRPGSTIEETRAFSALDPYNKHASITVLPVT